MYFTLPLENQALLCVTKLCMELMHVQNGLDNVYSDLGQELGVRSVIGSID